MTARTLIATFASVLLLAGPAGAAVQLDLSSVLNADVVVNTDAVQMDGLDQSQADADGSGTAFLTQAAAVQMSCPSPLGLPDNGAFAANPVRPAVQLTYRNSDSGDNVRRSPGADSYSIPVPAGRYQSVHVYASGGGGSPAMEVALNYASGMATTASFTVSDWFFEPGIGSYTLVDDMDRTGATPMACEDANTVAIFGHEVSADGARDLTSITITRPMADAANGVLVVFGAIAEVNRVTVSRSGSGTGTVTSNPPGISCGSDCVGDYAPGQQVVLTATPDSGSVFSGWSGACSGTDTCVLAGGEQTVTATFDPAPPPGGGTGNPGSSTQPGTTGTGPVTTAPPDTSAPVARVAVAARRIAAVVRRGLPIAVTCNEACSGRVELFLDARSARRLGVASAARPVRIGRATVDLAAAGRRTVTARLTRRARSRLRRARRVTISVRLTVSDAAGNTTSRTSKVRLRG